MSDIIQQTFSVQSCIEVASGTFLLRFVSPEICHRAHPGNFVNIRVDGIYQNPLLRRPFSISRVDGDIIELLFNVVGLGTEILSKKKSGDQLDVLGPLGNSFHLDAEYEKAFIVAGGLGVAPFPFLSSELIKLGRRIITFVGFRSKKLRYVSHLQNIHIATDDGSEGFYGSVVQLFEQFLDRNEIGKAKIFTCGPINMLKAIAELAEKHSICCEISLERQMACGIGICQGCPVERINGSTKYALVCKDGPTFISTEVKL